MNAASIVERLRAYSLDWRDPAASKGVVEEAADTIEALTAEVERQEELVRVYRGAQLRAEQKLCRAEDDARGWKLRAERLEAKKSLQDAIARALPLEAGEG